MNFLVKLCRYSSLQDFSGALYFEQEKKINLETIFVTIYLIKFNFFTIWEVAMDLLPPPGATLGRGFKTCKILDIKLIIIFRPV